MNQPIIKRSEQPNKENRDRQVSPPREERSRKIDIAQEMIDTIKGLKTSEGKEGTLKDYSIRTLVEHAEVFGPALKQQRLETNQIRKFLDAINQLKAKLVGSNFSVIETEVILLKPKLAYAAARQDAVKLLNRVMTEAINKVHSKEDFYRLVQLVESTIAYHKAEDGK